MTKPKKQFTVVALEDVFKAAVEVDGIPTLEDPTNLAKRRSPTATEWRGIRKI